MRSRFLYILASFVRIHFELSIIIIYSHVYFNDKKLCICELKSGNFFNVSHLIYLLTLYESVFQLPCLINRFIMCYVKCKSCTV